jgi:hypothetical protein
MNNKTIFFPLIGVLLLAFLVYLVWTGIMKAPNLVHPEGQSGNETATLCTADAFRCDDGTWVGRSGPACEFVCPVSTSTQGTSGTEKEAMLTARIGQASSVLGIKITPLSIIEDSRCPTDVQCIQAGTVRISATLVSGMGTAIQTFALNVPITTEAEMITLIAVTPEKRSAHEIASGEYRFTFRVSKR